MKDKIKVIMEETGCSEEQALHCLEEYSNNFTKAIYSLKHKYPFIIVIKGKFMIQDENLYGIFIVIAHSQQKSILRHEAIVSSNPALYEKDTNIEWADFEKGIYSWRLNEGTVHELTQKLQHECIWQINAMEQLFFDMIDNKDWKSIKNKFEDIFSKFFNTSCVLSKLSMEEINIHQFKTRISSNASSSTLSMEEHSSQRESNAKTSQIYLNLGIKSSKPSSSKKIEHLKQKDLIMVTIDDNRDIAQYISQLLGGWKNGHSMPVTTNVEKLQRYDGKYHLITKFGPNIFGQCIISPKTYIPLNKKYNKPNIITWIFIGILIVSLLVLLFFII